MRKKEKEIIDIKEIEAIIHEATHCHIGLADGDEPYVVAMNYGYVNKVLYIHCAAEGRKLDLIRKNNKVCAAFETDVQIIPSGESCKNTEKYRSVIVVGRAYFVSSEQEKIEGLIAINKHYKQTQTTFPEDVLKKTTVIRVEFEKLTGKKSGF